MVNQIGGKGSLDLFIKFVGVKSMRSFKEYTPKENATENKQSYGAGTSQRQFDESSIEDLIKQVAGDYNGKTNAQMLAGILKEAEQAKRQGRLSNAQIDEFYLQFSPMLNDFQRKKLQEIVKKLKNI